MTDGKDDIDDLNKLAQKVVKLTISPADKNQILAYLEQIHDKMETAEILLRKVHEILIRIDENA